MRSTWLLFAALFVFPSLAGAQAPATFEAALSAAKSNIAAPGGAAFDDAVGLEFARLHVDTIAKCAGPANGPDLDYFDLLLRLDAQGAVVEALAYPETSVAKCLRPATEHNVLGKPPRGDYWVHVGMTMAPPPGTVAREPGGVRLYLEHGRSLFVREPAQWAAATVKEIPVDLIFFPRASLGNVSKAHIRILAFRKVSENTQEDLDADIAGYREKFEKVRFEDFPISHPTFRLFPKKFVRPGEMYEFVTYVNPGTSSAQAFSVSLVMPKKDASPAELRVYQDVVESLRLE